MPERLRSTSSSLAISVKRGGTLVTLTTQLYDAVLTRERIRQKIGPVPGVSVRDVRFTQTLHGTRTVLNTGSVRPRADRRVSESRRAVTDAAISDVSSDCSWQRLTAAAAGPVIGAN